MVAANGLVLPPSSAIPLVGRERERGVLSRALKQATLGHGSAWLLEGPGGIGKTRLARWTEEEAEGLGLRVRWGRCMKEVLTPFFPWQQVFRGGRPAPPEPRDPLSVSSLSQLPAVLLLDESRTTALREWATRWAGTAPVLLVSRDRPATLRGRLPGLARAKVLWLSRVEGEETIAPGAVDALGKRLEEHLRSTPGSVVVLEAIEFLATQNGFSVMLTLLQLLADIAQQTEGHVLVTGKPGAFDRREVALLEALGSTTWQPPSGEAPSPPADTSAIDTARPPPLVWLDYLDRLEAESEEGPQLVVLDDLQWADPASISGFQFLARNVRSMRVLLLATARTDDVRPAEERNASNFLPVLEAMDSEGLLAHLRLGGLSAAETFEVMNGLLPAPLEVAEHRRELDAFVQRAGGNPYFALSTTQMLVESGVLQRRGARVALALPEGAELPKVLPESVQSSVRRRLALIPPGDRTLLEVGAVQGREFELPVLAEVLDRPLDEVERSVHLLETTHRFLSPSETSPNRVAFTHPLHWEGVLAACDEPTKRAHALALAGWWAEHRPSDALEVSRLYWEAREPAQGLPWLARAIDDAVRAQASAVAERCALWRLDLQERAGVPPDLRAEQALGTAQALGGLGDFSASLRLCRHLSSLPLSPGLSMARSVEELFVLTVVDVKAARAAWEALAPRLDQEGPRVEPAVRARAQLAHAQLLGFEGKVAEARALAGQAREMAEAARDPGIEARALYSWSFFSLALGERTGVRERLEAGLSRTRASGQVRDEAHLINGLARLQIEEGALREAEASSGRSAECFHQVGHTSNEAMLLANRASLLVDLEEPEKALEVAGKGFELSRRQGFARGKLVCEALMGHARVEKGDVPGGLPLLEEGVAGLRERGFLFDSLEVAAWLVAARYAAGQAGSAREFLRSLDPEVETAGLEAQVAYRRAFASVLLGEGDLPQARKALDTALALLEGVGAWAERARLYAVLAELEAREGNAPAATRAWAKMNEVRARIGLKARAEGDLPGAPGRAPTPPRTP